VLGPAQPMRAALGGGSDAVVLIYSGEVCNFTELRGELGALRPRSLAGPRRSASIPRSYRVTGFPRPRP
jgi:asparagine synthetase B (glutamine-hydrolysing)